MAAPGDLVAWAAAVKIAVDPLLSTYQHLRLLVDDVAGTGRTVQLAVGVEALPLLDESAESGALPQCPGSYAGCAGLALRQMSRILKPDASLFLSVDIGGVPTPDEPTVFSADSLTGLLQEQFVIVHHTANPVSHSGWREGSVRILARKRVQAPVALDREHILQAYLARLEEQK